MSAAISLSTLDPSHPLPPPSGAVLEGLLRRRRSRNFGFWSGVIVVAGFTSLLLVIIGLVHGEADDLPFTGIGILFIGICVGIAVGFRVLFTKGTLGRVQRFLQFGADNGFDIAADLPGTTMAGSLFGPNGLTRLRARWSTAAGTIEVGQYRWFSGGGRSGTVHEFGYVAIPTPSMRGRSFFAGRPANFRARPPFDFVRVMESSQIFSPIGEKPAAIAFYRPELVAILMDGERPFTAGTSGGRLYAYFSAKQIADADRWKQIQRIIAAVADQPTH